MLQPGQLCNSGLIRPYGFAYSVATGALKYSNLNFESQLSVDFIDLESFPVTCRPSVQFFFLITAAALHFKSI